MLFLDKPRLVETSPQNIDIALGNDLRLYCTFLGNPRPIITWRLVDSVYSQENIIQVLPEHPERLIIKNVSYLDEGLLN